jgi:hypothetical protein
MADLQSMSDRELMTLSNRLCDGANGIPRVANEVQRRGLEKIAQEIRDMTVQANQINRRVLRVYYGLFVVGAIAVVPVIIQVVKWIATYWSL